MNKALGKEALPGRTRRTETKLRTYLTVRPQMDDEPSEGQVDVIMVNRAPARATRPDAVVQRNKLVCECRIVLNARRTDLFQN